MKLRPHHLIDIIASYGQGVEFTPHPYGHAQHTVAERVLHDLDLEIEFVLGADSICDPCMHLQPDRSCDDVLEQLEEKPSKQAYNDGLDSKLFPYLEMQPGDRMTVREFLDRVNQHFPGIEELCTHPKEDMNERRQRLEAGLKKLDM